MFDLAFTAISMQPEVTDSELIKRIRKGEYPVLDQLYNECLPTVREEGISANTAKVYLQDALIRVREEAIMGKLKLGTVSLREYVLQLCRERWENAQKNTELDRKVIECLKSGDGWSFYYMQRMYFPAVFAMVRHHGGTRQDAEDVIMEGIQALLLNVKEGRYEVQDTARLKTYFLRVCRNLWVDEMKRKSRSRTFRPLDELDGDDLKYLAYYDNYESEALTERQRVVQQAFSQSTDTCRQVLSYFYYENLSHDEIAARMGYKNSDTCKTQKMKCLTKLKVAVKSRFERLLSHKPQLADED